LTPHTLNYETDERFAMIKQRHAQTFEKAIQDGKADFGIIPLCRFLNAHTDFFTASSCAGRAILLNVDSAETKQTASFLYKTHAKADANAIWKKLHENTRNEVWFKQEPFILHLGAQNLANANKLISCARKAGLKRGGIMLAKPGKFILELTGTTAMSAPVKHRGKILVAKEYLAFLVKRGNQKLAKNKEQLARFEKELRETL